MAPVATLRLGRRAFRAVRVPDLVLRERMLAGATFIELAVTARQAFAFGSTGSILWCRVGFDLAGGVLMRLGITRLTFSKTCTGHSHKRGR